MYGLDGRLAGILCLARYLVVSSSKFDSVSSRNSEYTFAVLLICSGKKCSPIIILSTILHPNIDIILPLNVCFFPTMGILFCIMTLVMAINATVIPESALVCPQNFFQEVIIRNIIYVDLYDKDIE